MLFRPIFDGEIKFRNLLINYTHLLVDWSKLSYVTLSGLLLSMTPPFDTVFPDWTWFTPILHRCTLIYPDLSPIHTHLPLITLDYPRSPLITLDNLDYPSQPLITLGCICQASKQLLYCEKISCDEQLHKWYFPSNCVRVILSGPQNVNKRVCKNQKWCQKKAYFFSAY